MHVNKAYLKVALPVATFPLLDQHQSSTFQPIQGLDQVSRQLSLAQFPGALSDVENGVTVVTKPARQNPGRREVIGIIDTADAAAFLLDSASLRNACGCLRRADHRCAARDGEAPDRQRRRRHPVGRPRRQDQGDLPAHHGHRRRGSPGRQGFSRRRAAALPRLTPSAADS